MKGVGGEGKNGDEEGIRGWDRKKGRGRKKGTEKGEEDGKKSLPIFFEVFY